MVAAVACVCYQCGQKHGYKLTRRRSHDCFCVWSEVETVESAANEPLAVRRNQRERWDEKFSRETESYHLSRCGTSVFL